MTHCFQTGEEDGVGGCGFSSGWLYHIWEIDSSGGNTAQNKLPVCESKWSIHYKHTKTTARASKMALTQILKEHLCWWSSSTKSCSFLPQTAPIYDDQCVPTSQTASLQRRRAAEVSETCRARREEVIVLTWHQYTQTPHGEFQRYLPSTWHPYKMIKGMWEQRGPAANKLLRLKSVSTVSCANSRLTFATAFPRHVGLVPNASRNIILIMNLKVNHKINYK